MCNGRRNFYLQALSRSISSLQVQANYQSFPHASTMNQTQATCVGANGFNHQTTGIIICDINLYLYTGMLLLIIKNWYIITSRYPQLLLLFYFLVG